MVQEPESDDDVEGTDVEAFEIGDICPHEPSRGVRAARRHLEIALVVIDAEVVDIAEERADIAVTATHIEDTVAVAGRTYFSTNLRVDSFAFINCFQR